MSNENSEKKVLVTGASGGIGRAIALACAKEGYEVVAHYNNGKEKAEALKAEIEAFGGKCSLLQFNISDRSDCNAKLEAWSEETGESSSMPESAATMPSRLFLTKTGTMLFIQIWTAFTMYLSLL